jgi:HEAT repeat protein
LRIPICFTVGLAVASLLFFTNSADSDQLLTEQTSACNGVDACLLVLDSWSKSYNGRIEDVSVAVINLKRFGVPMRRALLDRGVGADLRSRQLADLLLSAWGGWTKDDVPELAKVLASNHGGMIAHSLGEIGTPEAIEVLANDLRFADMGQTDYVLSKIGPRAVPYLFPLLEDPESARAAAGVITKIGAAASPFAETWSKLAADPDQQIKVRLGALKGIAALGKEARGSTGTLHPLLTATDEPLRLAAIDALLSAQDPAAIQAIAGKCRPQAAEMDYYAWLHSTLCLQDIWRFGSDAAVAGPQLLPFLKSNSANERLMGAITFGVIGYRLASVPLRTALDDADWRVVYAAARSLGRLRAVEAASELRVVSNTHWLPEVRQMAIASLEALELPPEAPTPALEPSKRSIFYNGSERGDFVDVYVLDDFPSCAQKQWQWQSILFSLPDSLRRQDAHTVTARLKRPPGLLTAVNHGEFGGGLVWNPDGGRSAVLFKDFGVMGIEPDDDGAVFITGLNHMGLNFGVVGLLARTAKGTWSLRELAHLPSEGTEMSVISPGLYAAWSGSRVVVFNNRRILGLAACRDTTLDPGH